MSAAGEHAWGAGAGAGLGSQPAQRRSEAGGTLDTWCGRSQASLVAQSVKNLPAVQGKQVPSLAWEDPLEEEMAAHASVLAWRILWTESRAGSVHGVAELDMAEVTGHACTRAQRLSQVCPTSPSLQGRGGRGRRRQSEARGPCSLRQDIPGWGGGPVLSTVISAGGSEMWEPQPNIQMRPTQRSGCSVLPRHLSISCSVSPTLQPHGL